MDYYRKRNSLLSLESSRYYIQVIEIDHETSYGLTPLIAVMICGGIDPNGSKIRLILSVVLNIVLET